MSILIFSCSTKRDILYLQNAKKSEYKIEFSEYKVKVDDILDINVDVEIGDAAIMFNDELQPTNTKEAVQISGYQVNSQGYIFFPSIGEIYVLGKSLELIRKNIEKLIIEKGLLTKPTINIKLVNSYFVIIGEVNLPGRYDFLKNNLNILEAIGIAGDLTINGQRNNVKIIRNINNQASINTIDLTSDEIFNNDNFQIFSGDIIVVNQNSTRVKNAGIIGNSGTLLSLLSFLLSSIILITNN